MEKLKTKKVTFKINIFDNKKYICDLGTFSGLVYDKSNKIDNSIHISMSQYQTILRDLLCFKIGYSVKSSCDFIKIKLDNATIYDFVKIHSNIKDISNSKWYARINRLYYLLNFKTN